jgi:DNA polymerase-3 subunit gamma/tau
MQKSLYQKYRPAAFSEVVGHQKILQTLKNALASGQIGHAYLFAGPRGTGKTTLARLLARAVNCLADPKTAKNIPCLECDFCKSADKGQAIDIIEIDAASNRGIDEIRDLREKIKFAPTSAKYKVYIIDEVHMLTKEAFNALLKTLEEPPAHVIFIMATTEAYKLPATILSRVQRFDFGRVTPSEIAQNLKHIIELEKLEVDDGAIALIAAKAEGSHRDAISLLEQIKSYATKISLKEVEEVLGIADQELVDNLLLEVKNGDRRAVLTQIENYQASGFDLSQLALSLSEVLRKILFTKAEVKSFQLETERVKKLEPVIALSTLQLVEATEVLLKSVREIKASRLPSLPLELALSKIVELWSSSQANSLSATPAPSTVSQEKTIEPKIDAQPEAPKPKSEEVKAPIVPEAVPESKPKPKSDVTPGQMIDSATWQQILDLAREKNHSLSALLRDIKPIKVEGNRLELAAKFKFHADKITELANRTLIEKIIEEVSGQKLVIHCQVAEVKPADKAASKEDLIKTAEEIFS